MANHMIADVSIITLHGKTPRIHETAFIAPGCRIIGDVEIGEGASIWFNCVIRADVNLIRIGARSNIQDGTVIHCDAAPGFPTLIGEDALVGHMAMLHGCTIADRGFVGLGSIVMDGCVIESDAMLAAGAMLTPGKRIETRQMWGGRPARFMREIDDVQKAGMQIGVAHYVRNAQAHKAAINGS
jgi:gamma-carbonic anhydrase